MIRLRVSLREAFHSSAYRTGEFPKVGFRSFPYLEKMYRRVVCHSPAYRMGKSPMLMPPLDLLIQTCFVLSGRNYLTKIA
ncbi:MAG: hypothetical protein ABFC24_11660 [Methanoregulaceae archaeon]